MGGLAVVVVAGQISSSKRSVASLRISRGLSFEGKKAPENCVMVLAKRKMRILNLGCHFASKPIVVTENILNYIYIYT